MDELLRSLIEKRCRRTITVILSAKERDLDGYLPDDVGAAYRKVVLDSVNDFHNFIMDILRSVDDDSVTLNDLYLKKIDEIYEAISNNGK
jgi:hypothetical protein